MRTAFFIGLLLAVNSALAQTPIIKIDGSSTVFPITEAMSEEFQVSKKGKVRVTVGISGTGGGFKKFCRGETDVQNASRPISASEIEACKKSNIRFIELPIAYDATVVAVNPKNDFLKEINVADLKKIWEPAAQGKITNWNQINAVWPKEKIKLYGAGADSGTFDYFTEAIVGKAKSSRGDYTASEDDNTLVTGIANDKFAIGYLPLAYYEENKAKLKALAIIPAAGKAGVYPSKQTVENSTYTPLSRPIFIYVTESSLKRAEVKEFVQFYLKNAEAIVPTVKYVALPKAAYTMATENLNKNKVGTVFEGHSEVGMSIQELLKREGKM
ncbi:MAG: PstS family phosphate ABC transporter substrate-binding protein [Bdellovibrionia bacterium]